MTEIGTDSEVGVRARASLLRAIDARVSAELPPEALADLAAACRELRVHAGHPVADRLLTAIESHVTDGTIRSLRPLAEAWACLQPPGRVLDLVAEEDRSAKA